MAKKKSISQVNTIKVIIFIVEGETEVEFYEVIKQMLHDDAIDKHGMRYVQSHYKFEKPVNMQGIGKYQTNAVTQFKHIKKKCENMQTKASQKGKQIAFEYYVYLCIDTDVFEFQQNPPLDKEKLKKALLSETADCVFYIEAVKSIEDWFLEDINGIMGFLSIKSIPNGYKKEKNGENKLNHIFKQAGKTYIKGRKVEGFVKKLDIAKIKENHKKEFSDVWNIV